MAPASRTQDSPLNEALARDPQRFDFHQAVRLLELAAIATQSGEPVGLSARLSSEAVHLAVHPSLAFSVSAIRDSSFAQTDPESPPKLEVTFAGLIGAAGLLPPHYSELVHARQVHKDRSLRDFLDALHRRTLALFHRAWRHSHFPFAFELAAHHRLSHDAFTSALLSLGGLGDGSLRRRQAVDDLAFAFNTGAFANQLRSAAALEGLLSAVLGVPFKVEQLVGSWLELPRSSWSTLVAQGERGDDTQAMGLGLVLGQRVWDVQSRVRLVAGPLTLAQFDFFTRDPMGRIRVWTLAKAFFGDLIQVELECVLAQAESAGTRLDGTHGLGLKTWVERVPHPEAQRIARFQLHTH